MICPYCNQQVLDGSSFCIYCGRQLPSAQQTVGNSNAHNPAPPAAPQAAGNNNAFDPTIPQVYDPMFEMFNTPAPEPAKTKKASSGSGNNTGLKAVIAVLIAIILLLGIVGTVFVIKVVLPALEEEDEDRASSRYDQDDGVQDDEAPEDAVQNSDVPVNNGQSVVEATAPVETNPYDVYLSEYPTYILSGSDRTFKCYSDIQHMSDEELYLAEQEIYARHGRTFSDANVQAFFEARSWYTAGGTVSLNAYEEGNLELIRVTLAKRDGTLSRSGNPYLGLFGGDYDSTVMASNSRYLYASDLRYLTTDELCIVRNEILARHGYVFLDADLREYFYSKTWYKPVALAENLDLSGMNKYENNNMTMVKTYELRAKGTPLSYDHEYIEEYNTYRYSNYIFSDSSSRYMSESELWGMTADELELARNEIYARNGYTFSDDALREYFMTKSWYFPNTVVGDQAALSFSAVELANIELMRNYENWVENGYY